MIRWYKGLIAMPLSARIVAVTLVLLLTVQAASFWTVSGAVDRQVRVEISHQLGVGEKVWNRLLDQNAIRLREASSVLAADFGFRAAVASGDRDTISSALDNNAERIGAPIAALMNPALQLVSSTGGTRDDMQEVLPRLGQALANGAQDGRLAIVEGKVYQFVMVPVRAPLTIGWVLMGFPVGATLLGDMQRLTGLEGVLSVASANNPLIQTFSTLPSDKQALKEAVSTMAPEFVSDQGQWMVKHIAPEVIGGTVRVSLVGSVDQLAQPFRKLEWTLGLITVLGVLLFGAGSWLAVRRVTRPLKELTQVTRALRSGQFDVTVPATRRRDELGALARGFDEMRSSISQQREEILRLAYWDRLTGLPNRESFRETLQAAISGSRDIARPLVVVTLNLDRFKHVNDVLGYAFGDTLLQAVAHRLTQQVHRVGDMVARLGGDEFAILLTRSDLAGALTITQRITQAFEAPLALDEQTVDLSASMGVACWPADAPDADLLMSRSEIAMHAAKSKTAGVLLYTPSLDSSSAQTLSLLSDLRHALHAGQLRLFLQPKLDLSSGQVYAAESLVRWQHPTRGLVPPLQFIPFAEQTGFVRQLTLWVFEAAAQLLSDWPAGAPRPKLAINLSTRDLLDVDFPHRLASLMERHQVCGADFCLEITESAIMDDPERAENTLNQLANLGFKLSIDDFGTGYSSLAYLKRLPVHELKIDKSFVIGMTDDESDAKIVRSTVELAHNLGLTVVAEGVENQTIIDALIGLHCDVAQGYFIGRPMPATDFPDWLFQRNPQDHPHKIPNTQ